MELFSKLSLVFLLATLSSASTLVNPPAYGLSRPYISHFEKVLGTSMELKIYANSEVDAVRAESAVMVEITRLDKILSGYDPNSEFSEWFRSNRSPVNVSPELLEVLGLFDQWKLRTGGALDPSAEVINQLWKKAASLQRVPSVQDLAAAIAEVKETHWSLDLEKGTATHLDLAPLMLNSFAKSYIIRHAADKAMAEGQVNAIVVNIGGDLVVSGQLDETVQISDPAADAENAPALAMIKVNNKAVATSGNYRRGELINGHWYSHIVDPRTGQPADNILSATVIASNATDAGALATVFNVLSPEESVKLASQVAGVDYLIVTRTGERIASKGWTNLALPTKEQTRDTHKVAGSGNPSIGWANDFELLINLEINLQKEGFVKRPYVAIWIEDENHAAVRTIALWHQRDRWLPELKSWYLKYRGIYSTDNAAFSSISSATRSAGKYSVKWDGKDDKGDVVKPGKYTVKIEASREHGTYQLMRQDIECDDSPKTFTIAGGSEISSANLDYRKKANGN